MEQTIVITLPLSPALFGALLGVLGSYISYAVIKFVVSLWTGS